MLRLTEQQLTAALSGLNPTERAELLQLLEIRAREEAEQPRDDRPSIELLFSAAVDEAAEASGDPQGYRTASASHRSAVKQHTERLLKVRPMPDGAGLAELQRLYVEAVEAARAEGHGPADELIRKPPPAKLEPDPIELVRRKALPRTVLRDLEDTQTRTAETAIYESIRSQQDAHFYRPVPEQRLSDFRGSTDAPLHPPAYPDS
jgi:hypothetical protein